MAKIGERLHTDNNKLIVEEIFNPTPTLDLAKRLRSAGGEDQRGEHRLIGVIPMEMLEIWAMEAGVKYNDPAMKEIVKRKMLSGEFANLRVWGGTY